MNRGTSQSSGQTLPLFAIIVPGLLALMALGLDGAQIFLERRDAQGAADLAAVAGAKELPDSKTDANAAAELVGQANGYTAAEVIPDANWGTDTQIEVTINTSVTPFFMPILDFFTPGDYSKVNVSARAVAEKSPGSSGAGPGVIFAGGDTCTGGKYGVDVSGSNNEVYGNVHSNADSNVGGANNIFTETTDPDVEEAWTYVGFLEPDSIGNGNVYEAGYPLDVGPSAVAWPGGWAPSDVTSAFLQPYRDLAIAQGNFDTSKIDQLNGDGVYYTTHSDGMDISSISGATGGVLNIVLIAPNGPIKISASSLTFNVLQDASLPKDDLLMLSGKTYSGDELCDKFTVAVSGSTSTWNGVLWGPGGLVEMSGSSNTAVNGSLVGWAVRLNGSDIVIRNDGSGSSSPPEIAIVE